MTSGYVYVLVNSSLPGLVKVGKTTRLPSERVGELSSATGVPTPFIVAFEQFFRDCDAAEDFVHAELERRGLRQSNNREFFRCTPNEVVRIVLSAPGAADAVALGGEGPPIADDDSDLLAGETLDDALKHTEVKTERPWTEIYEMAEDCYYGHGDRLQDYPEALRLFQQAARLGCPFAYERIGDMFRFGNRVKENQNKALEYYKSGAGKGNYFCWAAMANLFVASNQTENAAKCFARYFKERSQNISGEIETYWRGHDNRVIDYILMCLDRGVRPDFEAYVEPDAAAVAEMARGLRANEYSSALTKAAMQRVLDWLAAQRQDKACSSAITNDCKSAKPVSKGPVPLVVPREGWRWPRRWER